MKERVFILICLLFTVIPCQAAVITVDDDGPADFNNIQAAINDANNGDTVVIAEGIYTGTGNRDIDFLGKAITVRSIDPNDPCVVDMTIIDSEGSKYNQHRGFVFVNGEGPSSVLSGLTITNGYITGNYGVGGGGIYCYGSGPTIKNCKIINNYVEGRGGGISGGSVSIIGCTIRDNVATYGHGGAVSILSGAPLIDRCDIRNNGHTVNNRGALHFENCNALVTNCLLTDNKSQYAIYCQGKDNSSTFINCTIVDNGGVRGGGITCEVVGSNHAYVFNCILWGNGAGPIDGPATVQYSNVEYGYTGVGNIDANPLFLATGYYHLDAASPCIDSGTNSPPGGLPSTDLDGNPRLVDGDSNGVSTADMGAYEYDPNLAIIWHTPWAFEFFGVEGESNPADQILSIRNMGSGTMAWEIIENCPWLEVNPASDESSGEIDDVNISVDISGLLEGSYSCKVLIISDDAGNGNQIVDVDLFINRPKIELSATQFLFLAPEVNGANPPNQTLGISNSGVGILNWQISEDCNWLSVEPNNGSSTGEVDDVNVSVDISGLAVGNYNFNLTVSDPNASNSPQVVGVLLTVGDYGGILYVPSQCPTIQSAIDIASDGDVVVIEPGVYTGDGNRDIDFLGKSITVRSIDPNDPSIVDSTIINCQGSEAEPHRGFNVLTGGPFPPPCIIIDGLTITNGYADYGGAIHVAYAELIVRNSFIVQNTADYGGGICCREEFCTTTVENCSFAYNTAQESGGGICSIVGTVYANNCTFVSNQSFSGYGGGGIFCIGNSYINVSHSVFYDNTSHDSSGGGISMWGDYESADIENCTFYKNSASYDGGAFSAYSCSYSGSVISTLKNSIVWDNEPNDNAGIYAGFSGKCPSGSVIQADLSILQKNWANGTGIIVADPCFADPNGDCHLKSQAGRWDPITKIWVKDAVTSIAIDAGDPNDPNWMNELWPHGKRINIGAYGGTPEASMSLSTVGNIANLDNDEEDTVDIYDLALFTDQWCLRDAPLAADLDRNSIVDFEDFALIALEWLNNP